MRNSRCRPEGAKIRLVSKNKSGIPVANKEYPYRSLMRACVIVRSLNNNRLPSIGCEFWQLD
jgi:hypothetical protein